MENQNKKSWWQRLLRIEVEGGELSAEGKEILRLAESDENWTPEWEKLLKDNGIDVRNSPIEEINAFRQKLMDDAEAEVQARWARQAKEDAEKESK